MRNAIDRCAKCHLDVPRGSARLAIKSFTSACFRLVALKRFKVNLSKISSNNRARC